MSVKKKMRARERMIQQFSSLPPDFADAEDDEDDDDGHSQHHYANNGNVGACLLCKNSCSHCSTVK